MFPSIPLARHTHAVYVAAAKARKARMTERGAEVEQLMSLAATPLLVDMSYNTASISSGGSNKKSAARNDVQGNDDPAHNGDGCEGPGAAGMDRGGGASQQLTTDSKEHQGSSSSNNRWKRKSGIKPATGSARNVSNTNGVAGGSAVEVAPPDGRGGGHKASSTLLSRSASTPSTATLHGGGQASGDAPTGTTTAAATAAAEIPARKALFSGSPSPRELDATRIVATASTPQLPCFSLGSSPQLTFRSGGAGQQPNQAFGLQQTCRGRLGDGGVIPNNSYNAVSSGSASSPDVNAAVVVASSGGSTVAGFGRGHARQWAGASVSDRTHGQQPRNETSMTTSASRGQGHRPESGVGAGDAGAAATAAAKAAVVAARNQASTLLASHLMPFPTITKNRALHAVSQPIVKHSEGFADACRGERSRAGTTAWRVAREARYDGLVAAADRLSIVRQIEAGCDALQGRTSGRRVSAVA